MSIVLSQLHGADNKFLLLGRSHSGRREHTRSFQRPNKALWGLPALPVFSWRWARRDGRVRTGGRWGESAVDWDLLHSAAVRKTLRYCSLAACSWFLLPTTWDSHRPSRPQGRGQCIRVNSQLHTAVRTLLQIFFFSPWLLFFTCLNKPLSFSQLVVHSLSCVWVFGTLWAAAHQASLAFTISWCFLRLMSIELMMPSNYLFLCCPLLLLPSVFPSFRVFFSKLSLCIRWPKYCSFSISPPSEYSELISFRIDWFDLLAVQSLLQHHGFESIILQHWAFFMVQLSHLYMTTGKMIALTVQTFVGKVISLFFNTLSRFVIASERETDVPSLWDAEFPYLAFSYPR